MHLEQAYDDARELYRQARAYVRGLASFGLADDDLEKDALGIVLDAMHDLRDARSSARELAAYAASLGHPRKVVIDVPDAPQWDPMTPACPVWLRDEMQMGLS